MLIIGILAAVALPQYEIAVAKAKTGQIVSLVRSFANAEEIYFLENGEYTYEYDDLDVTVPSTKTVPCRCVPEQTCYDVNGWTFELYRANPGGEPISVEAYDGRVVIAAYFEPSRKAEYGRLTCIVKDEASGHKICKALRGKLSTTPDYYVLYN